MKTDSEDYVLRVNDANVRIKEKSILKDISLTASSGNIMAILGPTGTLLSLAQLCQSENIDPILETSLGCV